ncbi:MAG: tripartite tricarboxylate transporter substrate binding protein [Proteobacteria bacterium]|nr:tripartite tricarboxylate transporter substrate binding protein [Pseudomonadota bacterium]
MKKLLTVLVAGIAGVLLSTSFVLAQVSKPAGYPTRPLTMIVPFGAGGGSDQLARAMAAAMDKVAGIEFQVVNKPGGGGTAAIPDFMLAPADGYTVLEHIDNAVSAYAKGDIRENPARDWVPLCMTQITFSQIYVRPDDERFGDWDDVVAFAKANPNGLTMANLGKVGSMELVVMHQLQDALGIQIRQVAFDKPAERYGALIGGQVDLLFEQPGDVRSFLDAGTMVPVLTFLDNRPDVFADVPTHIEAGADFDALTRFRGFYVKRGVPRDRLAFLQEACAEGFKERGYADFNRSKFMHLIDSYRDTEGSIDLINGAVATYQRIYKDLGIGG